jgi:hypothetical protein
MAERRFIFLNYVNSRLANVNDFLPADGLFMAKYRF